MPGNSDQYDFFVSYARKDNTGGWINRFVEQLQEEHRKYSGGREFRVFFDTSEIRSLDDWRHRIYESVAASRLLVAFISPAYLASEWCRREWRTWIDVEIAKHVLSDGAAPIYIVEVPWMSKSMSEQQVAEEIARLSQRPADTFLARDAVAIAGQVSQRQLTAVRPFYDAGLDALRHEDLRKVLAGLAKNLSARSGHVEAAAHSKSTIPPYNRRFVGRLEELALLRERLHQGRTGVISGHKKGNLPEEKSAVASVHGLGGIGKTELAFTYAHAFAGLYPGGRFLVPCDGRSDLRQAMLALDEVFHDRISDEQRKSLDLHFGAIRECLRERLRELGRILLVLDNVTNLALLNPEQTDPVRMLGDGLHLLATTRLGAPEAGAYDDVHWLTLGELTFEDSLRLLEKYRLFATPAEQTAAEHIARRLGGFALCVEVAGAYLGQHPEQSYAGFLETMGLSDLEQVDQVAEGRDVTTRRHNNEKRLGAILAPTLASLPGEALAALRYATFLPPDHIVLPWLSRLAGGKHPALAADARAWQHIVTQLASLALLTRGQDGDRQALDESHHPRVLRCHRLLQDYIRARLTADEKAVLQQSVDALVKEHGDRVEVSTQWDGERWELDPLDALANIWAETGHDLADWLLTGVGVRWHHLAEWAKAEALFRKALELCESSLGPGHADVAKSLGNLAVLLTATNRLPEAEPLARRTLAIYETAHGPSHPTVATALGNLAEILRKTDRPAEAEPLLRRAIEIVRETQGPRHSSMTFLLNNLAILLQGTNRGKDAEALLSFALVIDKENLGPFHPDVALRLGNLANQLFDTNRLADAEPLIREALAINERNFGPDHPSVAGNLSSLAQLLEATGRRAEAEPLIRRALSIGETCYGPDHPSVANRLDVLADLLRGTDREDEAEPLLRRALAIDEQSFGPDHPSVASRLNSLAMVLHQKKRLPEAEALYRRALAIDERSLGPENILVSRDLYNLAFLLALTLRLPEAESLLRRAVKILLIFTQATGYEHSNLQTAVRNYSVLLQKMGARPGEALAKINALARPHGINFDGSNTM